MFVADGWADYEILDTSGGEKLERWGKYLLVRPDPQVIWNTERRDGRWRKINARYHRSTSGGGEWEFIDLPKQWTIGYQLGDRCLTFHLKPFSFKHTGLFPEQAVNWEWFSGIIRKAVRAGRTADSDRPVRVLNLFAYTGGATIAAASAGAVVTHVDASRGMTQWAKENAASSGLADAKIRWLTDDCRKFVEREIRRGNHYDGIIMDPPSYGRGPKGELWKIEDHLHELVKLTASLLSEQPLFYLINSYTTGLAPGVLTYLISTEVVKRFGGVVDSQEVGLPVSDSALYLPCGAAGRWQAKE
jgi:23S rRNA (cytosine1962-C5)-methyltransferase